LVSIGIRDLFSVQFQGIMDSYSARHDLIHGWQDDSSRVISCQLMDFSDSALASLLSHFIFNSISYSLNLAHSRGWVFQGIGATRAS
jgi:hypothetical protein